MGGKAGKILPLVAMAVATYFTAGAAAAGAAAQTAGTTASAMAGSMSSAGLAAAEASMMANAAAATAMQQATLAGLASSAIGGISGAFANAEAQKQALAFQADQRRVQQMTDKLNITQQEAAVQKNLRRVLAAQTVLYNAQGIDPSAGSPFAMQEGAYQEAQDDLDVLATRRHVAAIGDSWNAAALSSQRRAVNTGLGRSVTGSLLNFGKGAISLVRES